MRLPLLPALALFSLALPSILRATTYNDAQVFKVDGTVMVQPANGSKPFALQTESTVAKGDILTCYDKSWVILKTHRGDLIGLDGDTVVTLDEYYIEGPDRQIRLVLQRGNLFLKTNGSGSRQSFFEINTGSVVSSIDDTRAILHYDGAKEALKVQYIGGKMSVIDKETERQFGVQPKNELVDYIPEGSEGQWQNGVLADKNFAPMDQLDVVNYNKFFDGEPRLAPANNNFLLHGSD